MGSSGGVPPTGGPALPTPGPGDAGKVATVNAGEDNYELDSPGTSGAVTPSERITFALGTPTLADYPVPFAVGDISPAGALPAGWTLDGDGTLHVPKGLYAVTVTVTPAGSLDAETNVSIQGDFAGVNSSGIYQTGPNGIAYGYGVAYTDWTTEVASPSIKVSIEGGTTTAVYVQMTVVRLAPWPA